MGDFGSGSLLVRAERIALPATLGLRIHPSCGGNGQSLGVVQSFLHPVKLIALSVRREHQTRLDPLPSSLSGVCVAGPRPKSALSSKPVMPYLTERKLACCHAAALQSRSFLANPVVSRLCSSVSASAWSLSASVSGPCVVVLVLSLMSCRSCVLVVVFSLSCRCRVVNVICCNHACNDANGACNGPTVHVTLSTVHGTVPTAHVTVPTVHVSVQRCMQRSNGARNGSNGACIDVKCACSDVKCA